jgi:shikimate kinase
MNEAPIFLVGFMGSGKTRVGKLLARMLKWKWLDLDQLIVNEAGKSIPEIFKSEGESGFRKRERACLQKLLSAQCVVVSCGGGVVTQPENLKDLVAQPRVVCLRIQPETVFRRVGNDPRRPLLCSQDPLGHIRELMKQREAYYEVFRHQVDVDRLRSGEVVNRILALLELKLP